MPAMNLPGWNSHDAVERIHFWLEGGALLFFAALVLFEIASHRTKDHIRAHRFDSIGLFCFAVAVTAEICAYPYSRRNDELSTQEIGSLSNQTKVLKGNLADANAREKGQRDNVERERLARLKIEERLADRTLSDSGTASISKALSSFPHQDFSITTYWHSREPMALSNRLLNMLTKIGWKYLTVGSASNMFGGITGVQVWIHPSADEMTKEAATSLVSQLTRHQIVSELILQNPANNPKHDVIHLNVGSEARLKEYIVRVVSELYKRIKFHQVLAVANELNPRLELVELRMRRSLAALMPRVLQLLLTNGGAELWV